jgi:hypothetical protein
MNEGKKKKKKKKKGESEKSLFVAYEDDNLDSTGS